MQNYDAQQATRDQLLRQGVYRWEECHDCTFIGYGRPTVHHGLAHPDHRTFSVLMPVPEGDRRGRPVCQACVPSGPPYLPADRIVNGRALCEAHFYQDETVMAELERAAAADERRDA